jgi:hypothetical protein
MNCVNCFKPPDDSSVNPLNDARPGRELAANRPLARSG